MLDPTSPLCYLLHTMFIRRVRKKDPQTGSTYFYYQLVESHRTPNGPRQRTLLNLGKLDFEPKDLKRLVQRIEEILRGQIFMGAWRGLSMNRGPFSLRSMVSSECQKPECQE